MTDSELARASAELRFEEQVAIVTGAGRGLGRAHAMLLAERGARVVVNDLGSPVEGGSKDDEVASAVVTEIEQSGGTAVSDTNDVAVPAGAEALVRRALDAFGRVDMLVNNAGILRWSAFPEVDGADLEAHLRVHALGSFHVTRAAWPLFQAQGYGRIVMKISSAFFGLPNGVSYGTAKGAVFGLTRSLATAGAGLGIGVNAVAPMAWTRMMAASGVSADSQLAQQTPPELVSLGVAYLLHTTCSDNGQVYAAGGGRVAKIFIGETSGFAMRDLTPEDVRDGWSRVNDTKAYFVPSTTASYSAERAAAFESKSG
jgi:NAD(P)-dependent dehydrogenase (short-subunit alcohol dehydrogenase family)